MAAVLAVVTAGAWAVHQRSGVPHEPVVGAGEVVVEVRGDVAHPGFHPMHASATISKAIQVAGGRLHSPDARPVEAGMSLVVADGAVVVGVMEDTLVVGVPVDLNRASVAALEALPGVGRSRAEAIVDDRRLNGELQVVEDLTRIRGIGPATVQSLRPFVVVR
jgi:competence protein ComEA